MSLFVSLRRWCLVASGLLAAVLLPSPIHAQASTTISLKTLHTFRDLTDGAYPYGGLFKGDDNFYGTTYGGGTGSAAGGTLFSISPNGILTTFVSYTNAQPFSTFVSGVDGALYGTASAGGQGNAGFIFRLTPGGPATFYGTFDVARTGIAPRAGLTVGADGLFYGTTFRGGTYNAGTVYSVDFQGNVQSLHSFSAADGEGTNSYSVLVQGRDGNFYGTAASNGPGGAGTVFKVTPLGTLTTVYAFTGGADGGDPRAGLLMGSDGNFYGTTNFGGAGNAGTVFKLTPQGTLTTLHTFGGLADGAHPTAPLIDGGDGAFYGTTLGGGATNNGTIFSITPAGSFVSLYAFTGGSNGSQPSGPLAVGGDGVFYGTTGSGGDDKNRGTIYRLDLRTPPQAPGSLSLSAGSFAVSEGAGSATLTVTRNAGSTGAASVRYTTLDGSARQGADYAASSGQLLWRDGDAATKSFRVPIVDRGISDGSTRTFTVRLQSPVGAALGAITTATVIIREDDPPPLPTPPTVTLTVLGDGTATVGGGSAKVLFRRDGDANQSITVNYQVKGKARNGTDYELLSGKVTIPAGKSSYKLKIKPRRDASFRGTTSLKIRPAAASDGSFQVSPAQVKVKLINNG